MRVFEQITSLNLNYTKSWRPIPEILSGSVRNYALYKNLA